MVEKRGEILLGCAGLDQVVGACASSTLPARVRRWSAGEAGIFGPQARGLNCLPQRIRGLFEVALVLKHQHQIAPRLHERGVEFG